MHDGRMKARTRRKPARPLRSEPPEGSSARPARLIARGTADQTLAIGLRRPWFGDLYHFMLQISWCSFLFGGMALYIAANAGFALLYLLQPGAIANARPGSFADAFFFSVQTIATIGYGQLVPATLYANLLVTIETASGLMFLAIATDLVFARFSRPTARRFYDVPLARYRSPVSALTFTVMHEIDRDGRLYGAPAASLSAENAELVVTAPGIDETIAQRVHARTSYLPDEILWGRRFADVIGWTEDGRRVIDYRRFHDTVPLKAVP